MYPAQGKRSTDTLNETTGKEPTADLSENWSLEATRRGGGDRFRAPGPEKPALVPASI